MSALMSFQSPVERGKAKSKTKRTKDQGGSEWCGSDCLWKQNGSTHIAKFPRPPAILPCFFYSLTPSCCYSPLPFSFPLTAYPGFAPVFSFITANLPPPPSCPIPFHPILVLF